MELVEYSLCCGMDLIYFNAAVIPISNTAISGHRNQFCSGFNLIVISFTFFIIMFYFISFFNMIDINRYSFHILLLRRFRDDKN